MNSIKYFASAACVALAATQAASAQLVMGSDDRSEPLQLVDLRTIRPTDQYPAPTNIADSSPIPGTAGLNVWGLTGDDTNRRLLIADVGLAPGGSQVTSNIYAYDYDTQQLSFLGRPVINGTGQEISIQGLAATTDGRVFGVYNVGGTPGEGLYELDLDGAFGGGANRFIPTEARILARNLPGGESAYDFQNLDYDPVTDSLYTINSDNDAPGGRGLYSYDLTAGTLDFVVASPDYRRLETDFDGLATGDGKAYFTTDEPGFVYIYDLVNGGPYTDFLSPFTQGGLFAGSGYAAGLIPEPASLGLLGLAGLALLRRR